MTASLAWKSATVAEYRRSSAGTVSRAVPHLPHTPTPHIPTPHTPTPHVPSVSPTSKSGCNALPCVKGAARLSGQLLALLL